MEFPSIFRSYTGMYVIQSFFHSVFSLLIVEIAIKAWRVKNPLVKQRFLFMVVLVPVLSFPVYEYMNPQRGSIYFRFDALFDSSRWMNLEIFGVVPAGIVLLALFFLTSVVFLLQELIPIVRHTLSPKVHEAAGTPAAENAAVAAALSDLPLGKTEVFLLDEEEPVLFSTTGKRGSIYLSSGLLALLTGNQLRAAVAHEFAHVSRSRRPLLVVMFLLRMAMFFNPLVLMTFRRIVQEDEKICDDVAVSVSGDPGALAGTLRKLYVRGAEQGAPDGRNSVPSMEDLEAASHRLNIESRVARLEKEDVGPGDAEWFGFVVTGVVVAVVSYYVV